MKNVSARLAYLAAVWVSVLMAAPPVDYLVPGIGVERVLEIGQRFEDAAAGQGVWIDSEHGLQYQLDKDGSVVLIRCQRRDCASDRNVSVGTRKSVVLQRYGAPGSKRRMGNGLFYQYQGIGFAIEADAVTGIYILPR